MNLKVLINISASARWLFVICMVRNNNEWVCPLSKSVLGSNCTTATPRALVNHTSGEHQPPLGKIKKNTIAILVRREQIDPGTRFYSTRYNQAKLDLKLCHNVLEILDWKFWNEYSLEYCLMETINFEINEKLLDKISKSVKNENSNLINLI